MTFPHDQDDEKCNLVHTNISTLYGTPVTPIKDLPAECTCGASLTYADNLVFVNRAGIGVEISKEELMNSPNDVENVLFSMNGNLTKEDESK